MDRASRQLSNRIVSFYRGWRALVERTQGLEAAESVVIDDLAPPAPHASFSDMGEVLRELDDILRAAAGSRTSDPLRRYSHAKLRQSRVYLTQTAQRRPTRKDVEGRGVRWTRVAEGRLSALARGIEEDRRRLARDGAGEGALSEYLDRRLENSAAPARIRRHAEAWLSRLYDLKPRLVPLEKGRRAADRFFDALMGDFYAHTDIPALLTRLRIGR